MAALQKALRTAFFRPFCARAIPLMPLLLFVFLVSGTSSALTQTSPLRVVVDEKTYQVQGTQVLDAQGATVDDKALTDKARFAAMVLDKHILRSEANRIRFNAEQRASVFSVSAGNRLALIDEQQDDIDAVKRRYAEELRALAKSPNALATVVAKIDLKVGVLAYRESARIYRKVMIKKELLTYPEAVLFLGNEEKLRRMDLARALEARLGSLDKPAADRGSAANDGQGVANRDPNAPGQSDRAANDPSQGPNANDPNAPLSEKLETLAKKLEKDVQTIEEVIETEKEVANALASESLGRNDGAAREYAARRNDIGTAYEGATRTYREGTSPTDILSALVSALPPPQAARPPAVPAPPRYAARPVVPPQQPPHARPRPPGSPPPARQVPGGRSDNSNSTITSSADRYREPRVSGSYRQVTPSQAATVVKRYKSIPGGVTLEGGSADLSAITRATYERNTNAFILNGDLVYLNPVSAEDAAEIFFALAEDDSLGVSLTGGSSIVYGKLNPSGPVAIRLKLADRFLGGITWGERHELPGYRYAPGYAGSRPTQLSGNLAVYFNINAYKFAIDDVGEVRRDDVRVDITLVPLSPKKNADGGHAPDFDRIERGDVPPEYVANVTHLQDNFTYYARERIVRVALAYGEVAAFARALKLNGVDLRGLAQQLNQTAFAIAPGMPTSNTQLARSMRLELARLGCDTGSADAGWDASARSAMREFLHATKLDVPTDTPSPQGLAALQSQKSRACPLKCAAGQIVQNDRCVAKPAAVAQPVKRLPPPARQARPQASGEETPRSSVGACGSLKGFANTPEMRALIGC